MKREDLLLKIRHEALAFEPQPSTPFAPLRADDLLKYDGGAFIDILYRRILQREPDASGRAHYFNLVNKLPKPLIIYFFSRSEEAKQKQVEITGIYSALISFYLRMPLILVKALLLAVNKAVCRVNSSSSSRKTEEESDIDFFKFYLDFEEEFRGSEERTGQNLTIYLSLLQAEKDLIVDLGSGRGEWLRLLKKEGFNAKGVEINPYFIENCEEEGLQVIKKDVFEFLKGAATSSIGAITAFHLIEHLNPQRRLPFLNEIHRVLKPGGVLILETPNPRNILVSAGDFWRDLEHITPVFPDSLSFMAKFVGFIEAECYFFNESRTALSPCSDANFRHLKDYIHVSRDYALFARKS